MHHPQFINPISKILSSIANTEGGSLRSASLPANACAAKDSRILATDLAANQFRTGRNGENGRNARKAARAERKHADDCAETERDRTSVPESISKAKSASHMLAVWLDI